MRKRDKEWLVDVILSLSLRERDEIDAKSTNDINIIKIEKKRSDNEKTMKNLRAKIILIARLYKFKAKKIMSVLDKLIKISRVTRIELIKKLKEMTTRLKKIAKKKKAYQKKSNTWTIIARRDVAMIKLDIDTKKTSTLSSKKELKRTIKMIE